MANNGEKDLAQIREDMSQLRDDLSAVLHQFLDQGAEKASSLKDRGADAGKRAIEATENKIKERPFMSLLVVFLIGIVLGKLFDQRMRA